MTETTTIERTRTVLDRATGELIDLDDAPSERLAEAVDALAELRAELAEGEEALSDELVARLDRQASWTLRVGDPTGERQWEITAPSPVAGTRTYDALDLYAALELLIEDGTIDTEAAAAALRRTVTVTFAVAWEHDLEEFADKARASTKPPTLAVDTEQKPVKAGITRVAKLGDHAAATLADASRRVGPAKRRAKVTRKGRG